MNPIRWVLHALLGDDPPREPKPDEIVRLSIGASEVELRGWAHILQQNGIRCEVAPVGHVTAFAMPTTEFAILIQYGDVARARELLALPDGNSTVW